jgi:sodium transport system permease protein
VRLTPPVRAVFGLEIRSLLRDVRTVLMSVVLPVLLIPALLLVGSWVDDRRVEREETRTFRFAVVGTEAPFADSLLAGLFGAGDGEAPPSRFRRVPVEDPAAALEAERIDLYLEAMTPEEWRTLVEEDEDMSEIPEYFEGVRALRIFLHSSRTASREGADLLRDHLYDVRSSRQDSMLVAAGFPVQPRQVALVETLNMATDEEVQGARLGRFLTLILLSLMILGGSAISIDTLAGEKERGTLVTLLTTAATRYEIITGKLLAVIAVAFAIALIQILNLWVFLGLGLIDPGEGFAVHVSPAMAGGLLVLYLPAVALTAGVLLLTSAHAHSYKEAQLYMTPVLLGMVVPTLAPFLPDISLRSAVVVVPLANLSVAARDILVGQIDPIPISLAWLVTAVAAAWVTTRSVRALHNEELITGDTTREEFLGGPELFQKRVLRWFLVFWAVKVLIDVNLSFEDIRVAAVVGVGLVFLLFPLLVIRHFRLDPVKALALRNPRPGVWLGVLIGAPAGIVAANTVFRLMDFVVPVPTQLLEDFGQALMPEAIPVWQLILLLSVIPGITEELTFRGVLLHGLRKRLGPVALVLAVGAIFGFFHFQIFRIPSTALLGMILTAVTLMTGSIFPAIVWHTLNNALAIYLGTREVEFTLDEWWWAVGSFLVLAVAFWIIWRNRTPYPEVGEKAGSGRREVGLSPPPGRTARPGPGAPPHP